MLYKEPLNNRTDRETPWNTGAIGTLSRNSEQSCLERPKDKSTIEENLMLRE